MAYVGQTRAAKLSAQLTELGFGECTVREEFPPRRFPWFFDNGAFRDFTKGVGFLESRYQAALDKLSASSLRPDFVVAPDIVAGGLASLRFSESWASRLAHLGLPVYLVVQDGMTEADVRDALTPYAGVFVGGSLGWKLRTAPRWVEFAHLHGRQCHIGRMGTRDRVRAARRWGADSIDSCTPLWSAANLARFVAGFRDGVTDLLDGDEGVLTDSHGQLTHVRSAFVAPLVRREPEHFDPHTLDLFGDS